MAKNSISRVRKRELESPDEFVVFLNKLLQFIISNKIKVGVFFIVVFIIIAGLSGMTYYAGKNESKASLLVSKSIHKYQSALKDKGAENAFEDVEKEFEIIIEKYSGKNSGKFARVFFAGICFDAEKYEKAISQFNLSLHDFENEDSIKNLILSSLGYSHEQQKDYKTAAMYFEMITAKPAAAKKDEAFFNTGMLYAKIGDNDKSMEAFQKIVDDYKESMYFELVKEKIAGAGQ